MDGVPFLSDNSSMSTVSAATRVAVPDDVITRIVGGSTVILDVHSGRSFTLDEIGSRVWALLAATGSVRETLDALAREFTADPAELERDVARLVEQLAAGSLLTIAAA